MFVSFNGERVAGVAWVQFLLICIHNFALIKPYLVSIRCQLLLDKSIHQTLLPRFYQPFLERSLGAVTAQYVFFDFDNLSYLVSISRQPLLDKSIDQVFL